MDDLANKKSAIVYYEITLPSRFRVLSAAEPTDISS